MQRRTTMNVSRQAALTHDAEKCFPKILVQGSVNDGVDERIGVSDPLDDRDVNALHRQTPIRFAQRYEEVDGPKWKPTHDESDDDGPQNPNEPFLLRMRRKRNHFSKETLKSATLRNFFNNVRDRVAAAPANLIRGR